MDTIQIRGARTHNLQNVDVDLPRKRLIVITGLSGSGKSSLAFDTLYAEGQRRYVESLSAYARQFLALMEKPDVDYIAGLSPAIAIEQKSTSHNPRSTVGTITEIYDYLRLLYARVGIPRCPEHDIELDAQTVSQMVDQVLDLPEGERIMLLAPVIKERKGAHIKLLQELQLQGFIRARIDGVVLELDSAPPLDLQRPHTIEVVVDRLRIHRDIKQRLAESLETALRLGNGVAKLVMLASAAAAELLFNSSYACPFCGYSLNELEPRIFSFNNPAGACAECDGLGVKSFFDAQLIITHPHLSLAQGAIRGWKPDNFYAWQLLKTLAAHYNFSLEVPFNTLATTVQQIILHGNHGEIIDFSYSDSAANIQTRRHAFEGIIPNMQRRYRDTDSQQVRDDLAKYLSYQPCQSCHGTRLNRAARHVFIAGMSLPKIVAMPIAASYAFFRSLSLTGRRGAIAERIIKEICERLQFLIQVGLDYLSLERSAETLSGGEAQRIRLASQIGAGLVGVLYVLDEPSIGLHQRDNARLLASLLRLRDLGNTVIVVEHDQEAMHSADHILDLGPGAGIHGGRIVAQGTAAEIAAHPHSLTGAYLSGKRRIAIPINRVAPNTEKQLRIIGASGNNLKQINIEIPLGLFVCITGVSGSGKSTLINDTLYRYIARHLHLASAPPAACQAISGLEQLDKVVHIDQSPIGRTPRSNPATYTGLFTPIRELFASVPESRARGYQAGRFSFNVKGGRCETCQGDGVIRVAMHFLPDMYVPCDQCHGQRYNRETLDIYYKGRNIHAVLEMTVEEALAFYHAQPVIARKLRALIEVGLGYIKLGQNAITLSGGEAQRVKLARELSKRATGNTLYILDEPTTGLHFQDIAQLLTVLHQLRERGNSVLVIEHNLDVIKTADWIIDLGPEGGAAGGELVAAGTPEHIATVAASHTGKFLAAVLHPA